MKLKINSLYALVTGIGLLLAFWVQSLSARPILEVTPKQAVVWEDYLGVNAHFLWFTPQQYDQQMRMLKQLGLKWVRVDLHWAYHETTEGVWSLDMVDTLVKKIEKNRLNSLFYLVGSAKFASSAPEGVSNYDQYPPKDFDVFADRFNMLVDRYPSVSAWQVWNEENVPAYWQPKEDPEAYNDLLSKTVNKVREDHPNTPLVMGGAAYYSQMPYLGGLMFERLRDLGAFKLNIIADYHPYSHTPEGDNPEELDFYRRSEWLNSNLRQSGVKDIWATEWGWSSYSGPEEYQPIIGESGQADFTIKRLALISALDFDKVFLFALSDLDSRATVRDRSYGLLDLNGKPKPVYTALKNFLQYTGPALTPTQPPKLLHAENGLISIGWLKQTSEMLWVTWSDHAQLVKLKCEAAAEIYNPITDNRTFLDCSNGEANLNVGQQLQIVKFQ